MIMMNWACLTRSRSDSVEAHIDGFAALLFDAIRCDPNCGSVVTHYNGWVLRITHAASVVRRDAACCSVANKATYSASPALATTHGMITCRGYVN
jgi:hypothetical protein